MSSIRRPKLIQNDTFLLGGVETPGIPASEVLTLTGSPITKNAGDADFAATFTVVDANGVTRTGMKLRSTDRKVVRVNPDGTIRVMGGGACTLELDSGAGSGSIAVTVAGTTYMGEDPDTGVFVYATGSGGGGGGGYPAGVSSALAKALYDARDLAIEPGYLSDSNRWRIGVNQTTFGVTNAGGTTTRCSSWKSLNNDNPLRFNTALYQSADVSRNGALKFVNFRGIPGVGVTEVVTLTITDFTTNQISWSGSVSGSWGTTTSQVPPAGAPFVGIAANVGGGIGWVNGASHVFNVVADASVEIDANGHPTEANRTMLPVGAGAIGASGTFWGALAKKSSGGFNTWLSRGSIHAPATPTLVAEDLLIRSSSWNLGGISRNGCDTSTSGVGAVQSRQVGLASEAVGTALYMGGCDGALTYTWAHYDRASHGVSRHDTVSPGIVSVTAPDRNVYAYCDGDAAAFSANAVSGPYAYEIFTGSGSFNHVQYRAFNDYLRANAATYGGTLAPEFTGRLYSQFHHSVKNQFDATRMTTALTNGANSLLYHNHAADGAKTTEIVPYFVKSILRCQDLSKLAFNYILVGEGFNETINTGNATADANAYANALSVAAKVYRDPAVSAAVAPIALDGMMRPNIGDAGTGTNITFGSLDMTWVRNVDLALKASGSADVVAAGKADRYVNVLPCTLLDAAHNSGTYWQDAIHEVDPAGKTLDETYHATDAKTAAGI